MIGYNYRVDKWVEKREGLRDGGGGVGILEIIYSKVNVFVFFKVLDKDVFMWSKKEFVRGNFMLRNFYYNKNYIFIKVGDSFVSFMSLRFD